MLNFTLRSLVRNRKLIVQRALSSLDGPPLINVKNTANKLDQELEDALKIEASLFDNSTINHEPVKASEILKTAKKSFVKKSSTKGGGAAAVAAVAQPKTSQKHKTKAEEPLPLIKDEQLGLQFVRLSLGDRLFSTLMTKVRSRKRRDKDREIVIEGRRLIEEALDCNLALECLIFSKREELEKIKDKVAKAQSKFNAQIYLIRNHDLKTWTTLTTPPGLMAIFKRPSNLSDKFDTADSLPITVICDNIREPNNLGSIIRTCASLPCREIIVTKGCCDPWESKTLRGGCGGHFRVPIKDDVEWVDVPASIPKEHTDNCCIFLAENNLEKMSMLAKDAVINYSEIQQIGAHNLVIIGGESHGVSDDAYRIMNCIGSSRGKCLYIPLANGIDSLNVASALTLILFELRKHIKSKAPELTEKSFEEN